METQGIIVLDLGQLHKWIEHKIFIQNLKDQCIYEFSHLIITLRSLFNLI